MTMKDPLQISSVQPLKNAQTPAYTRGARRQEVEATMERLWLTEPEQFNTERSGVQRKRVASTIKTIKDHINLLGKRCADLGCGAGTISHLLCNEGARIDAVDIASRALELLKAKGLQNVAAIQDCLPATRLEDGVYDLVVCTETIGYLQPNEYRLLFAELSRLVTKNGIVVCSTPLDIYSENALERFSALAETEFEIDEWILCYDRLWMKCCWFFEAPALYIKSSADTLERKKELKKRKGLGRWWFQANTTKSMAMLWRLLEPLSSHIAFAIKQSDLLIAFFEKCTKFLWDESGISHALFVGKRRPLAFPLPPTEMPMEPKHKREVWD